MRKILILLLAVAFCGTLFAGGQPEPTIEISILHSGITEIDGLGTDFEWAAAQLAEEFPGVAITEMVVDFTDGSLLTMMAQLALGKAPNIYLDTIVRSGAFLTPYFALPLDDYISDLDAYPESTLAPYRRDGKLLGLPFPGSAQGMAINLDMMADIGYTVPDNWTIDDFLEMAALVKAKYDGEKWATGMFAGNQSGDYLINNWFAAAGVEYYAAGDYSQTTIVETGGEQVHAFFQHLMREGYIQQDAATLVDDDYVLHWAKGELAATAFFQPWVQHYQGVVAEQGYEPFDYAFVPFPRGPGVSAVPTYYMNSAAVVHQTGTEQDAVAARFVELLNAPAIQTAKVEQMGLMSNRTDVTAVPADPWTAQIMDIVRNNGIFDVGLTNPGYAKTRPQHFPVLQKVLNLQVEPADSIAEYAARINKALKD